MAEYEQYNNARTSIMNLIANKESAIADLENEIRELKRVRRMLDEEFKNKLNNKPEYLN